MRFILWGGILCLFNLPAMAADVGVDGPRIEINYKVVLSTPMSEALAKHDPNFRIWEAGDFHPDLIRLYRFTSFENWRNFVSYQTPSAVIGDFNGDGAPDVVLTGRDNTDDKVIVILSSGAIFNVVDVEKGPLIESVLAGKGTVEKSLGLVPPRRVKPAPSYNLPPFDLKTDAIEIAFLDRGARIFIYKDGKFEIYSESDD